jgi:hypothetical protein
MPNPGKLFWNETWGRNKWNEFFKPSMSYCNSSKAFVFSGWKFGLLQNRQNIS